jgi:hypothetical protein
MSAATTLATTRAEQLREREDRIRANVRVGMAAAYQIGDDLLWIRDDHLYEQAGFETWDAYLKGRGSVEFGIGRAHAYRFMKLAQIRAKLPEPSSPAGDENELSQIALLELGRLAPKSDDHAQRPDYDRLDRRDVARVLKRAARLAEEEGKDGIPVAVVRKAVDEELGVKRGPAPKSEPEPEPEPRSNFGERIWEGTDAVKRLHRNAAELDDRTFAREGCGPHVAFAIDEHVEVLEEALSFWRERKLLLVPRVIRPAGGGDQAAPPPTRAHALLGDYNRLTLKQRNEFDRLLSAQRTAEIDALKARTPKK